jgi:hypothetical protein
MRAAACQAVVKMFAAVLSSCDVKLLKQRLLSSEGMTDERNTSGAPKGATGGAAQAADLGTALLEQVAGSHSRCFTILRFPVVQASGAGITADHCFPLLV